MLALMLYANCESQIVTRVFRVIHDEDIFSFSTEKTADFKSFLIKGNGDAVFVCLVLDCLTDCNQVHVVSVGPPHLGHPLGSWFSE